MVRRGAHASVFKRAVSDLPFSCLSCAFPLGVSGVGTRKFHTYFEMTSRAKWLAITSRTSSIFFPAAIAASLDP
jgi:hypothetical protein